MKSHGTGSSFAQFNIHKTQSSLLKMRMCIPGQAQYKSLSQHLYLSSPLNKSPPVHLWFLYGLAHRPVSEKDWKGVNNVLSSIKIIYTQTTLASVVSAYLSGLKRATAKKDEAECRDLGQKQLARRGGPALSPLFTLTILPLLFHHLRRSLANSVC